MSPIATRAALLLFLVSAPGCTSKLPEGNEEIKGKIDGEELTLRAPPGAKMAVEKNGFELKWGNCCSLSVIPGSTPIGCGSDKDCKVLSSGPGWSVTETMFHGSKLVSGSMVRNRSCG